MNKNIFIICILMLLQACTAVALPILNKYSNFTPERQSALEKMSDFFEETVLENFPAETDTTSYKAFLRCFIRNGGLSDIPYVIQVDRKKLSKINADLFKDEIYYFFYAKYLTIYVTDLPDETLRGYNDTIPTVRSYSTPSSRCEITSWYPFLYNPDGYMPRIVEQNIENPMIRDMNTETQFSNSYAVTQFIRHILNGHLGEMSNPVVKQMASVFFWRYICFCGGVDLEKRTGFCDCEWFRLEFVHSPEP